MSVIQFAEYTNITPILCVIFTLEIDVILSYNKDNGKGGRFFQMPMIYKLDVLSALKEAGYNTNRIRKEKLIGEAMLQKIRSGQMPSWATLETICSLLDCQPGDLIAFSREEAAK